MFLLPSPPRVTRRSRLENILLLILRCLVLCFLAFAFARPYLSRPMGPDPSALAGQKILVLLDQSASMRRDPLWKEAVDKAKAVFRSAAPADQVACLAFGRDVHTVLGFEQWAAYPIGDRAGLAGKQLDDLHPGWSATHLGQALIQACETFESSATNDLSRRRIVLISDLQEGARLDGLQGFEWPHGVELSVETLKPSRSSNAGLQLAADSDEAIRPGAEPATRVRVVNSPDSRREQLHLGWKANAGEGYLGSTIDVYVPPGQSRVVSVPRPKQAATAERLVLTGDDQPFDNTLFIVPPKAERARIVYLGSEAREDPAQPLYYLRRAFPETRRLSVDLVPVPPGAPFPTQDVSSSRLLIVARPLSEPEARQVRTFLDQDRAVLMILSSPAMAPSLASLAGVQTVDVTEASDGTYAMLNQIDFQHPLFAPFADARYSDFTKIHFWKHRRAALGGLPGSHILARFDDGDAALAEIAVGKGRLWVLTSGWQPVESQLALSSKFVPLVNAMLQESGGESEARSQYQVGEAVSLTFQPADVTIRKPDASQRTVARGQRFTDTDQPGIYSLSSTQTVARFAVNLAPEEIRTAPLPLEELERLGVPVRTQLAPSVRQEAQHREHLRAAQLENRQKLWRWLIVVALVVLVMETWLAGRLTRRAVAGVPEQAKA